MRHKGDHEDRDQAVQAGQLLLRICRVRKGQAASTASVWRERSSEMTLAA